MKARGFAITRDSNSLQLEPAKTRKEKGQPAPRYLSTGMTLLLYSVLG
jgi:hypothetical protein